MICGHASQDCKLNGQTSLLFQAQKRDVVHIKYWRVSIARENVFQQKCIPPLLSQTAASTTAEVSDRFQAVLAETHKEQVRRNHTEKANPKGLNGREPRRLQPEGRRSTQCCVELSHSLHNSACKCRILLIYNASSNTEKGLLHALILPQRISKCNHPVHEHAPFCP